MLDALAASLGVHSPLNWYRVRRKDIKGAFGVVLRDFYGDSLARCLNVLRPEYELKPWLFAHTPANFFHTMENQRCKINILHVIIIFNIFIFTEYTWSGYKWSCTSLSQAIGMR